MSSSETIVSRRVASARLGLITASLLSATTLAGCSADLGRLDMASASLNSDASRRSAGLTPSEPMRRSYAGAPVEAAQPPASPYSYNPAPQGPTAAAEPPAPVRLSGLPEPVSRQPEPRRSDVPAQRANEPPRRDAPAPIRSAGSIANPSPAPVSDQATVEVKSGDTVYGIAKRHHVSIAELMSANNLSTPMIRPGQKLVLPTSHRQRPARRTARLASAPQASPPPPSPRRATADGHARSRRMERDTHGHAARQPLRHRAAP